VQICNGKVPSFGKYSFDSSEPISGGTQASSFSFLQEIKCTDEVAVTAASQKLDLSNIQEEVIKASVKKITEEFLSAKESGTFKQAYDMLDSEMNSSPYTKAIGL
jgi:hypothetical protein